MNVVVSAIVDPWVTTLSFVVALAMRIQALKSPIFLKISSFAVFFRAVSYVLGSVYTDYLT